MSSAGGTDGEANRLAEQAWREASGWGKDDGRYAPYEGHASTPEGNEYAPEAHVRGVLRPPPTSPETLATMYATGVWMSPFDTISKIVEQAWLAGYTACQSGGGYPYRQVSIPVATPDSAVGIDPAWLPLIHRRGEHPCGSTALYVIERPDPTQPARLDLLRIWASSHVEPGVPPQPPQWRVPNPSDVPECAACRQRIDPYTNQDVDWRSVYGT